MEEKRTLLKIGIIFLTIMFSLFISCSMKNNENIANQAIEKCIELCNNVKDKIDLSNGPCLSDMYEYGVDDWVCDVAHQPRAQVDNLPENQCQEYRQGKAHHFVEVNENCEFIRMY